jgi:hypothetical protein
MAKAKKAKTHFEQVPLEIIKDIPVEVIPDDELDQEDLTVDPPESRERHSRAQPSRVKRAPSNRGRR